MEKHRFIAKKQTTIKDYLQHRLKFSRRHYRRVKANSKIYVNGIESFVTAPIKQGDVVEILLPTNSVNISPYPYELDILYEDKYILAVNKPKDMLTHPTSKERTNTLINAVQFRQNALNECHSIHPIHRLDRETSGVVMIAKSPYSSMVFTQMFEQRKVDKRYLAIVSGVPKQTNGEINSDLYNYSTKRYQKAITNYKVINSWNHFALIEAVPLTGRTHQIRRHLTEITSGIVGDSIYNTKSNEGGKGQLLHALSLTFMHPVTKKITKIVARLPQDFKKELRKIQKI
ncbi:RluA family pseudouridine synthase [Proteinivorax hydrogeniformans]|uniref:Pseudouridine synthase n=1 Tax=Proteinivorax hydrogeniformans TaxID=1826727 RepID=A0AAU8HVX0_9FIRM